MRLVEGIQTALRAARVPGHVAAKVVAVVEEAFESYKISSEEELLRLPDWNLWLIVVKSILSPATRLLRREGYCHANAMLVSAVMMLDERVASMVRDWVKSRCSAELDPCCKNPPCCNLG